MEEQKIKNAAIEIIGLLAQLDLTPTEGINAILKALHFTIEKGICKTPEKTAQLVTNCIGKLTLTSTTMQN